MYVLSDADNYGGYDEAINAEIRPELMKLQTEKVEMKLCVALFFVLSWNPTSVYGFPECEAQRTPESIDNLN